MVTGEATLLSVTSFPRFKDMFLADLLELATYFPKKHCYTTVVSFPDESPGIYKNSIRTETNAYLQREIEIFFAALMN